MDQYLIKNRNYLTSHKLKLFAEDQWTYFLKYVQEVKPPYIERNPELEDEENDAFVIGQAVDDYLTFGKEYFEEKYIGVKKKVDIESSIKSLRIKIDNTKNLTTKTALKDIEKLEKYEAMRDMIQLTTTQLRAVKECVYEAREQTLFYPENYKKAELVYTFEGLPLPLKAELDFLSEDKMVIRDLKTCADLEKFHPDMYMWQMAFYHWIVEELYGIKAEIFLDVIEKPTGSRPFSRSRTYQLSQITILDKRREIIENIAKLSRAMKTGIWVKPSNQEVRFKSEYYGYEGYGRETEVVLY